MIESQHQQDVVWLVEIEQNGSSTIKAKILNKVT